ncbi:cytochrome c oxidase subunit 6A, mitochondrial-like [Eurosta solidaginis]|uniref:cytochrome c oxidase subunit 6A, mitochondrial-like n=1 Tax=Eurosta solidaginis TaxID=178769 RepID=UPI003530C302
MQRISKFSVKQILTGISRQYAAKSGKDECDKGKGSDSKKGGGSAGGAAGADAGADAKSGSGCAPLNKFDLCEMKKGGKDEKFKKCGAEDGKSIANMGSVGRKSSCAAKPLSDPKGSTAGTLRKICLFGLLPFVFLMSILIFSTRTHEEREEFKPWPHMYKRDKRFPWGDGVKSFFHNPHTNALPDVGYEDDI